MYNWQWWRKSTASTELSGIKDSSKKQTDERTNKEKLCDDQTFGSVACGIRLKEMAGLW